MTFILETNHLTKTFKGQEVVSDVSIYVRKGEIYGFLGPNGAGKTTIMKMITNLIKPTAGEIKLFGEKVTNQSFEFLKRLGSIIEYPIFYDKLTAIENLMLHCEYMGLSDPTAVYEALEMVHLQNIENKAVKDFSLGMKQRLGIARAIITNPELLILDEPINGLDPVGIKEMRQVFKRLRDEKKMTLFISSHILGEIEQIADTVGVIRDGRLVEEVSMGTIRERNTKYIEITTNQCEKAVKILMGQLGIHQVKTIDNQRIHIINAGYSTKEINKTLILQDVEIESIEEKSNSLEDYFLKLISGGMSNDKVDAIRN